MALGYRRVKSFFLARMVIVMVACLLSGVTPAYASVEGAQGFVKKVANAALETVGSRNLTVNEKEKKLEEIFEGSVDIKWIAKFVMGTYWRESSDDQRSKYTDLYQKYLIQSYVPKFRSYTDEKISFIGSEKEFDNEYLVHTEILSKTEPAYRVDYKVRQNADGSYQIFDIIAEGISMITTQRSEFGSILSRKGVDFLIEKLEQKTTAKT